MSTEPEQFSIDALAGFARVTRRTVRYYVQQGLLAPPIGMGRGAHYSRDHLDQLLRVKGLQEQGIPLESILEMQSSKTSKSEFVRNSANRALKSKDVIPSSSKECLPKLSTWTRVEIDDGVELHLRALRLDSSTLTKIRRAILDLLSKESKNA